MPNPIVLPVAEFMPDQPEPGPGSSTILNVYPRTALSYGPVSQPQPVYDALASRCQGATAFRDSDGNTFAFAGDATKLYMLTAGSTGWGDVSRPTGYGIAGEAQWGFVYFQGDVIATDFGDVPQYFTLGSSSVFADLPGSPPQGRYIGVVKNAFVVLCNTFDSTNGNMPQRVWWSAAGNAKVDGWPAPGSLAAAQVQSGATDLLGPAGWIQGLATDLINADAVIFQEFAVRRMTYAGPPDVFTFLPVDNVQGTPCPSSIVTRGGVAFYWGQDGIYAFDGGSSVPIGAGKVDKFLFGDGYKVGDVDRANLSRVVGTSDPLKKLIWWAYPSTQSPDGNPDKLLAYNVDINRFSLCEITCETILRLLTIGYTLDELYTVFGYTIDTVPHNFDSLAWTGGVLQLGLFGANHQLNLLTGSPLAATIDTSEMQPVPGRRTLITNTRPLVDGSVPSVAIGHRERLQDNITITPSVALNSMGMCPVRTSGRYLTGRITIPAGSTGWTNAFGIELSARPQGTR